ncbi:hypothetical protein IW15_01365 [Chryseobacterium soli]|uniref:Uncharacterized protein n=1 Tax=Chryseobacterium soli TaxID=445961 RepID=A0A086ABQ7_9FLAO|nr:hypothetical protein [Chryseobacterium soli]KFF14121.1 hypothetical protein IW15_01365 [Chryseobacterium soli]
MKPINALGTNDLPSLKMPKITKISGLGISPENKYSNLDGEGATYFHKFLPYGDINKLVDEYNDPKFLKEHSDADLLIFYLLGSKNELYITITGRSKEYDKLLSSQQVFKYDGFNDKVTFKEYIISNIIKDRQEAFIFTHDEISTAIEDAISDYKFITSEQNSKQESKFAVPSQVLKNKVNLKEQGIIKALQEVNRTIAKMRAEEKHAYNEWIISKADPYNYFWIHINNNKDFSLKDLKQLINQLKNYKKNMGELKDGRITSIADMNSYVEENLTAGGSMFKWFIDTPFFSLDPDQRKKYIELYCVEEEFFPRFNISTGFNDGDIVAALFKTCSNKQDLFDIIICLEQEGKLFHLLNNLRFKAFSEVCSIISSVYMTYVKKGEMDKKYAEALEFGRQILFDNRTFGNHNIEEFDTVHNKLKFTTDLNLFVKIGKGTIAAPLLSNMNADDLQKPISCNPLDIISLTPVEDIEIYKLKAGEIYAVPACFVYFLYNEETWKTNILAAQVIVQMAFCLIGVGEIMAAVEAGSTIGVAYSATGVAIDAGFGATLIPEFGKDHPVVTKYIHYAMWARLATDFINVKGLTEELNTAIKAKQIRFEPYEATIDGVKIIKGIQKTYKPLSIPQVFPSIIFPPAVIALYGLSSAAKRIIFAVEKVFESQRSICVFFKGAEIFRGSKAEAKVFMDNAVAIYKNEGQTAMENFFFAERTSQTNRLLHSQTKVGDMDTFVGTLIKKKSNLEYNYELHDFQYGKKQWTAHDKIDDDKFLCKVYIMKDNGKNLYSGDFFIPPSLNATLQANKAEMTDISLGKTMYDDGFVSLQKDLGKEFEGIYGLYQKSSAYVAYGGESVNLTKFKQAMQGKQITKENIIEAVKQITPYKWAKEKGFDKIELKTPMIKFDELSGDINKLEELKVIYYK